MFPTRALFTKASSVSSLKTAGKVICIGRNYAYVHASMSGMGYWELSRDHIKELNNTRPKQPFFFLKPTSSLLLPGEGPVVRPRGVDLHYEIELALIIGKQVKDLEASDEKGAIDAIESMCDFS